MSTKHIFTAGNTMVPAIVTLEQLGFTISVSETSDTQSFWARRGEELYSAESPEAVLGLIKMIEVRGWNWRVSDEQLDEILARFKLG